VSGISRFATRVRVEGLWPQVAGTVTNDVVFDATPSADY
jgi:hypothetical protein